MLKRTMTFLLFLFVLSPLWAEVKEEVFQAVKENNLSRLTELFKTYGNLSGLKDERNRTLLQEAVYAGNQEMTLFLLAQGSPVDSQDVLGWTALQDAVLKNRLSLFKVLLEKGANIHLKNKRGRTAFHLAAAEGRPEMIRLFLENGANIAETDEDGWTALHFAAWKNHLDILVILTGSGAQVNVRDNQGRTPLYQAALAGNFEAVKFLLEKGANPNLQDYTMSEPKAALDVASNPQVRSLLKEAGAQKAKSLFRDGIAVGPSFQYSRVINGMNIWYYGIQLEWYLNYQLSFYSSFHYGKGENGWEYFRFPGAVMALHNFGTLFSTNYDAKMKNSPSLMYVLFGLSLLIPEGIAFHIYPQNQNWLDVSPYVGFASVDAGRKGEGRDVNVGGEVGLRLNFFPLRRLIISPYFALRLQYNDGDSGFNTGLNVGYIF